MTEDLNTYVLRIDTDNPDVVERIKRAFDIAAIDADTDGNLHTLNAWLFVEKDGHEADVPTWTTQYDKEE